MIRLDISKNRAFDLIFDNRDIKRYTICKMVYKEKNYEIDMCEDYLYIFIESIVGQIKNMPTIEQTENWGKMGKWQEYYLYDFSEIKKYAKEIHQMKESVLVSAEKYGTFLYKYNGRIWLEINKGYDEKCGISPVDFYNDPVNYQLLFEEIPKRKIGEWYFNLRKIEDKVCLQ